MPHRVYEAIKTFNSLFVIIVGIALVIEIYFYKDLMILFLNISRIILIYMISQITTQFSICMNLSEAIKPFKLKLIRRFNVSMVSLTIVLVLVFIYSKLYDPSTMLNRDYTLLICGVSACFINYFYFMFNTRLKISEVLQSV